MRGVLAFLLFVVALVCFIALPAVAKAPKEVLTFGDSTAEGSVFWEEGGEVGLNVDALSHHIRLAGEPGNPEPSIRHAFENPETTSVAQPQAPPVPRNGPDVIREYHYYYDPPGEATREERGFLSTLAGGLFDFAAGLISKGANISIEGVRATERVGVEGLNYGEYVAGELTSLE